MSATTTSRQTTIRLLLPSCKSGFFWYHCRKQKICFGIHHYVAGEIYDPAYCHSRAIDGRVAISVIDIVAYIFSYEIDEDVIQKIGDMLNGIRRKAAKDNVPERIVKAKTYRRD